MSKPLFLRLSSPDPVLVYAATVNSAPGVGLREINGPSDQKDAYRVFEIVGVQPGTSVISVKSNGGPGPGKDVAQLTVRIATLQPQDPDLFYRGTYLVWMKNLPEGAGTDPILFDATSGLDGFQFANQQSNADAGPIPEGLYRLSARLDSRQSNAIAAGKMQGEDAISNTRGGIQYLPLEGGGPKFPQWGTLRVRLEPIQGDMHHRGGFYLHNSEKGYSHGCVEVGVSAWTIGSPFFDTLLQLTTPGTSAPPSLTLGVKYSYPDQRTLGNTKRLDYLQLLGR